MIYYFYDYSIIMVLNILLNNDNNLKYNSLMIFYGKIQIIK